MADIRTAVGIRPGCLQRHTNYKNYTIAWCNLKNQQPLQSPAKRSAELKAMESSIEDAMQQWLDNAQKSNDARNRIAVANGISRGVFGALHLGACGASAPEGSISAEHINDDFEEHKRAA